jgi:hypothetical protein
VRLERLLLGAVSLLLVGGFGLLGVGLGGGRPDLLPAGRLMVGAAVALACLPLGGAGRSPWGWSACAGGLGAAGAEGRGTPRASFSGRALRPWSGRPAPAAAAAAGCGLLLG